jgi:hypothetical protein
MNYKAVEKWLSPLDNLICSIIKRKLECDGLSRVISMLFQKEGIRHDVMIGSFTLINNNEKHQIPHHFWISLPNNYICDFRVRMWLRDLDDFTPHGIFTPNKNQVYLAKQSVIMPTHRAIFSALTDMDLDDYPPLH